MQRPLATRRPGSVGFALGVLLLVSLAAAAETVEDRKMVARRAFAEILDQGKFAVASELYAPDFVNHGVRRDVDLAGDQAAAKGWRAAFPDGRVTVEMILGEGQYVTVLWSAQGTNTGSGNGLPATGKKVHSRGVTIWRIAEGRIREEWSVFDESGILAQLGLLVPAAPPKD